MRKRRLILAVSFCIFGSAAVLLLLGEREPQYQRRSLNSWLRADFAANEPGGDPSGKQAERVAEAVRHIGTNGIPWFIKWLRYGRPTFGQRLVRGLKRVHYSSSLNRLEEKLHRRTGLVLACGMRGFDILGPQAKPAVPALLRLLEEAGHVKEPANGADTVLYAARAMGTEGLPVLIAGVTNYNLYPCDRSQAAAYLSLLGTNALPAVPALVMALHDRGDTRCTPRQTAMVALREIGPPDGLAALTEVLTNRTLSAEIRGEAANHIFMLGTNYALPALRLVLDDPEKDVREWAAKLLREMNSGDGP
jgi:hypothetical protein